MKKIKFKLHKCALFFTKDSTWIAPKWYFKNKKHIPFLFGGQSFTAEINICGKLLNWWLSNIVKSNKKLEIAKRRILWRKK